MNVRSVQEASWAVLHPKFLIPNGSLSTRLRFLELDRKKLLERVTAAETAILNRIQAISPSHAAERQAMRW